jgi:hypothetical protein
VQVTALLGGVQHRDTGERLGCRRALGLLHQLLPRLADTPDVLAMLCAAGWW